MTPILSKPNPGPSSEAIKGKKTSKLKKDEFELCRSAILSLQSQMKLCGSLVDEKLIYPATDCQTQITNLYVLCTHALDHATRLAMGMHISIDPRDFVSRQTMLEELVPRIEVMLKSPELTKDWPENPGITYCLNAGDSALEVVLQFAQTVLGATHVTRVQTVGNISARFMELATQPGAPDLASNPKIKAWLKLTARELSEHTIGTWWMMPHMHRDLKAFQRVLRAEFKEVLALKARMNAAQQKEKEKHGPEPDGFYWHGNYIKLGKIERMLIRHVWPLPNRSDTEENIIKKVWDDNAGDSSVRGAVSRIAKVFREQNVQMTIMRHDNLVVLVEDIQPETSIDVRYAGGVSKT